MASSYIMMGKGMKDFGVLTNKKEKVGRHFPMVHLTEVNTLMARSMGRVAIRGLMEVRMWVHSIKIELMDLEFINGPMVEDMKVIGKMEKWKVKASLYILMVESTKDSFWVIRNMVKEN